MGRKMTFSHTCLLLLLLALLQTTTTSSAQNTISVAPTTTSPVNPKALTYSTRPADATVALGDLAVFRCGVPKASSNLTFTFYGSQGNYSLTCPNRQNMEDIPQALQGSCDMLKGELLAVWVLKETSFSDNSTRVICQQSLNPDAPDAVLYVYDSSISSVTLIGCTIGGFFGILLVFGLLYIMLQRSEKFQKCFRGKETEDDMFTIVTKG